MEMEKTDDMRGAGESVGSSGGDDDLGSSPTGIFLMSDEGDAVSKEIQPQQQRTRSYAEMLVEAGMISEEALAKVQESARREGLPLNRILVRDGLILSRDLAAFTALHLGLTLVDLRSETLDPEVVAVLPEATATKYTVLALSRSNGTLKVAMADPTNLQAIQDLKARTGHTIEPVVAEDQELQEHIDIAYRMVGKVAPQEGDEDEEVVSPNPPKDVLGDSP